MLLGFDRKDAWSGKVGVAPTLMPSFQQLEFLVDGQELIEDDGDCGSLVLQHFASLQNVSAHIVWEDATAATYKEAEEAAAAAAAALHPNRPTLEIKEGHPNRPALVIKEITG